MTYLCDPRFSSYSGIEITAEVSRTSGVAPLFIFCNAIGTTGAEAPFQNLLYIWTVTGGSLGTWSISGLSKNVCYGGVASFVLPTAGTYTLTLEVFSGLASKSTSWTITATDPDTVYSTTNTIVVSTDGDFTGKPTGATEVPSSDFDSVLSTYLATGKRILFRGGQTFTASVTSTVDKTGPWTIGSFGTGRANVALNAGVRTFRFGSSSAGGSDGRVLDLAIDGGSSETTKGCDLGGPFQNILMSGCNFSNIGGVASLSNTANGIPSGMCITDGALTGFVGAAGGGNVGIYALCENIAIQGMDIDNATAGEHCLRFQYFNKSVISQNRFEAPAPTKQCITLRAPEKTGIFANLNSQYGVVSHNDMISAAGVTQPISIGKISPSNAIAECNHVIYEANIHSAMSAAQQCIQIHSSYTTVRNNLITAPSNGTRGVSISRDTDGNASNPNPTGNDVYNNSIYFSGTVAANYGVDVVGATVENTRISNNAVWGPNVTAVTVVQDTGTGTIGASGTYGNSGNAQAISTCPFVDTTPALASEFAAADYAVGGGDTDTERFTNYSDERIGYGNTAPSMNVGAL